MHYPDVGPIMVTKIDGHPLYRNKPLPAKAGRFLLRPPWCDMHGISRYCYNVLEVLSVELRPYNPGLGQGLKVIYFKPQNR